MTCPTSTQSGRGRTQTCLDSTRGPRCSNTAYRSESAFTSATTRTSSPTIGSSPQRCATRCAMRSATTSVWRRTSSRTELCLDRKGVPGWREGQRATLVDRAQRGDEILEALCRVVTRQRLIRGAQRRAARPADRRPVERQLRVKVVQEEVATARRDLVSITRGIVVDVVAVPLRPPVLLGGIEFPGNLRMALEGQHARERFAVGHRAVPPVVDSRLKNLDNLRGEEARGTDRLGQHVHVRAAAGPVI